MVLWNPALRALGLETEKEPDLNLRPVPIDLVAGHRSMAPLAAVARTAFRGPTRDDGAPAIVVRDL